MFKKVIEQLLTEVTKKSYNMPPCEVMFAHIKFLLKLICNDLLKVHYNLAVRPIVSRIVPRYYIDIYML